MSNPSTPSIFATAYAVVRRPMGLIILFLIGILGSACYPTKLDSYPLLPAGSALPTGVRVTEDYVRFVPTVLQIAVPIVLGDKLGLVQLAYVGIANTIATQGTKFLVDKVTIAGTRIGQRPRGIDSRHNMPSGHSSMSSCAVYFLGRRYNWWWALALGIIMLMTMYARVMLNAHTVSAVVAGALLGFVTTAWFTSPRRLDGLRKKETSGETSGEMSGETNELPVNAEALAGR